MKPAWVTFTDSLSETFASIVLTPTMLKKSIIDANREFQDFVAGTGLLDYAQIEAGPAGKVVLGTRMVSAGFDGSVSCSFYRPAVKSGRSGDPRFWPSGLSSLADAEDVLVATKLEGQIAFVLFQAGDDWSPELSEDDITDSDAQDAPPIPMPPIRHGSQDLKVQTVSLREMIGVNRLIRIPMFQRTYTWGKKELDRLWEDVDELMDHEDSTFLGSLVTKQAQPSLGLSPEVIDVIDGQQRITTLYAVVIGLTKFCEQHKLPEYATSFAASLVVPASNPDAGGSPILQPTLRDRRAFNALIESIVQSIPDPRLLPDDAADQLELSTQFNRIKTAIRDRCFDKASKKPLPDRLLEVHKIIMDRLLFVQIVVPDNMNANKVYDTLNERGKPLTTSDLVRNLVFESMEGTDVNRASDFHRRKWIPFEKSLAHEGKNRLQDYFFPFTLAADRTATKNSMYATLKALWQGKGAPIILEELQKHVDTYKALEFGTAVLSSDSGLLGSPSIETAVDRLHRLGFPSTAYPYLFNLLTGYATEEHTEEAVVACLSHLESFQVRRQFCSGMSAGFHAFFKEMWVNTGADPHKLKAKLMSHRHLPWPSDDDLREAIMSADLYAKTGLCRYVLLEYELHLSPNHGPLIQREQSEGKLDVEHIIPQSTPPKHMETIEDELTQLAEGPVPGGSDPLLLFYLDAESRAVKNATDARDAIIHTWGNLALLSKQDNVQISNSEWPVKLRCYREEAITQSVRSLARDDAVFGVGRWASRTSQLVEWAVSRWPR